MPDFLVYVWSGAPGTSTALKLDDYSLAEAKRTATHEFGDSPPGHEIRIMTGDGEDIVSRRRIGAKQWQDQSD